MEGKFGASIEILLEKEMWDVDCQVCGKPFGDHTGSPDNAICPDSEDE